MKEIRHSTCALDCPDTCSLLVTFQDGQAVRLQGDPGHAVTRGFLCGKVARYLERQYHPDRLLFPQKRIGAKGEGRFARISWDEALEIVASRLRAVADESGSEAILPYSYAGTMGLLNGSGMDRRFFHRLGASRLNRTICAAAGAAGIEEALGNRLGTEPEQFAYSKSILAWGANIHATNVHLWPFIVEARRKGAKFYAIDPVRTRTAALADRHYAPYPGSDLALALGLLHVIFREGLEDREYISRHTEGAESLRELVADYRPEHTARLTGIPAQDIETLAVEYATVRPAAIRLNYGIQRSERGGRAVRAVFLLPTVTGSWREVGGGAQLTTSGAFPFNTDALELPALQWKSLGREARLVNMSRLGHALTELDDPPVKAIVVYNSNPAAIAPDQQRVRRGLARNDLFTVSIEQFQTDTADFADILLPATTFLEHTDLYKAYGHYYLQLARPALQPAREARSNVEIFRGLALRMGFEEPCFRESEDDMIRATLASGHPWLAGITLERLEREHAVRLQVSAAGEPFLPFANGFPTGSGKANLSGGGLAYTPPRESRLGAEATPEFPLELVSSKNHDSMNSTFGYRAELVAQTRVLEIHPDDAARRRILDGDDVEVFNARGSVRLVARVGESVRSGVVRAPSVAWPKSAGQSGEPRNVNVLVSDRLTDIGEGPTFYNCLVDVRRVNSPEK